MTLLLKILLQLLTVGLAVLASSLDYVWHDKRTKKFKHTRKLLFSLAVVFLIISVVVTVLDDRESRRQQEQTLGLLTGGNSYCYIQPGYIDENTIIFILVNEGEYPLYDILIEVNDSEGLKNFEGLEGKALWDYFQKNKKVYNPGTLGLTGRFLDTINLTGVENKTYQITFFTRFATFSETLKLKKVNGEWLTALRVIKSPRAIKGGTEPEIEVLKQEVEPKFPTEKNGLIDWNK